MKLIYVEACFQWLVLSVMHRYLPSTKKTGHSYGLGDTRVPINPGKYLGKMYRE